MPGNFRFKDTPPALAYLLLNAMRSVYGADLLKSWVETGRVYHGL